MEDYSNKKIKKSDFASPIALALLESTPFVKTPIEAVIFHAEMLLMESGMTRPPFSPTVYAPLRSVKEVLYKDIKVDGRLIPCENGFIIELRKDRPIERINFTFAHELAHTFFYESVPLVKYRTDISANPHQDEDEERLCNIAASELLMPTSVFSKVVKDFLPSPQSLQKIAHIFETSLSATIVKLLNLKLWNASFILWKLKNGEFRPEWIARPNYSLLHYPKFELVNLKTTSVYSTLLSGEPTSNFEWCALNGGHKSNYFQSIRLNSKTVLSCFTNNSNSKSANCKTSEMTSPILPLKFDCKCEGTGWYSVKQDGRSVAMRCRASEHKSPIIHRHRINP